MPEKLKRPERLERLEKVVYLLNLGGLHLRSETFYPSWAEGVM
jgi:hypothetical protein